MPEQAEAETVDFEVFKSNMKVLDAFFILNGCAWQYTGMGELIGLDYLAADVIWRYSGLKITAETFAGVMLFSSTIVSELHKKREKK